MRIEDYSNKTLYYWCDDCKTHQSQDMQEVRLTRNEENGEYFPVGIICLNCREHGKDNVTFLNMNIPVIDDMEVEVMEHLADDADRLARRQVRKILWDFLPELQGIDRNQFEQDYAELHAERLADIRNQIGSGDNSAS